VFDIDGSPRQPRPVTELLPSLYLLVKGLHVVGFVSWFAGLFYVVRLFVYHVEAGEQPEPARSILRRQLETMERRLWFAITVPAMVMTLFFGSTLAVMYVRLSPDGFASFGWLHAKLALVAVLVAYHFSCGTIRRQLAAGTCRWTSPRLRQWNELATLLLVATVMVAVFKSLFSALWGTLALLALGALLALAVKLVRARARQPS
jgi:protoporphyrinogen IX oxidase